MSAPNEGLFSTLTWADFEGRSARGRPQTTRQRAYALSDEILIAIHDGDRLLVDFLMTELAVATALECLTPSHEKQ